MEDKEIKIVTSLLDREIDNFNSVHERTGKSNWLEKVKELETIKEKISSKHTK